MNRERIERWRARQETLDRLREADAKAHRLRIGQAETPQQSQARRVELKNVFVVNSSESVYLARTLLKTSHQNGCFEKGVFLEIYCIYRGCLLWLNWFQTLYLCHYFTGFYFF